MAPRTRNTPEPATTPEQPAQPPEQPTPAAPPVEPEQPTPAAPTVQQAAQRRGDAMANVKDTDRNMVDALLAERGGYVQRDMPERVKQVDEQLKLRGYRTA